MKKKSSNKPWIITIVSGTMMFIVAICFFGWSIHGILASVTAGIIFANLFVFLGIQWRNFQDKKAGFPHKDERTLYIEGRAAHYASLIGIYYMLALMWYIWLGQEFFGLPEVETLPALISSVLVMAVLLIGFRWYFGRRN